MIDTSAVGRFDALNIYGLYLMKWGRSVGGLTE